MINSLNLSKVVRILKGDKLNKVADLLNTICPLYGINTPDISHEFLSNVLHESSEFTRLEEGMNYQSIALQKLFSRKRISMGEAINYGRTATHPANKEMIANTIYGGEWGRINLGNIKHGDGWVFRGSGAIQSTGRANITNFTNYYNNKFNAAYSPEQMASLLRTDLDMSIHNACWFFSIAKGLIDEAIDDKMNEIVKKINGGYIGLNDRLHYLQLAQKYIL